MSVEPNNTETDNTEPNNTETDNTETDNTEPDNPEHPMWSSTTGSQMILVVNKPGNMYRRMDILVYSISKPYVYKITFQKGNKITHDPIYVQGKDTVIDIIRDVWMKFYRVYTESIFRQNENVTCPMSTRIDPNSPFQLSSETSSEDSVSEDSVNDT